MCINPSIESSSSSSSSRSDMQITRRLTTSSPARFASQSMPNNANSIDYEGPFISSLSMRERTTFFVIYQFRFRIETVSRRSSLSPLLYYGVRLFRKPRQTPAYIQTALNNHRERERDRRERRLAETTYIGIDITDRGKSKPLPLSLSLSGQGTTSDGFRFILPLQGLRTG